jgi:hypothetical protein
LSRINSLRDRSSHLLRNSRTSCGPTLNSRCEGQGSANLPKIAIRVFGDRAGYRPVDEAAQAKYVGTLRRRCANDPIQVFGEESGGCRSVRGVSLASTEFIRARASRYAFVPASTDASCSGVNTDDARPNPTNVRYPVLVKSKFRSRCRSRTSTRSSSSNSLDSLFLAAALLIPPSSPELPQSTYRNRARPRRNSS